MFKLVIMLVIGLGVWGGLSGALNFENKDGSLTMNIDKEKALQSLENGAIKAKNVINNIDKISNSED